MAENDLKEFELTQEEERLLADYAKVLRDEGKEAARRFLDSQPNPTRPEIISLMKTWHRVLWLLRDGEGRS